MELKIDVTDWHEETKREEIEIKNDDDIYALLDKGEHTGKIGRAIIVNRELGNADENIIKPNKLILSSGAQLEVSRLAARKRHEVETESGAKFQARSYVGEVQDGQDTDESYVTYTDDKAAERAKRYLTNMIPGYIWPRLLTLYEANENVQEVADELKSLIDEMVEKLSQSCDEIHILSANYAVHENQNESVNYVNHETHAEDVNQVYSEIHYDYVNYISCEIQ